MRFSAIFQLPAVPSQTAAKAADVRADAAAEVQPVPPTLQAPEDLELDLDARVRLVGEWQLGEGY